MKFRNSPRALLITVLGMVGAVVLWLGLTRDPITHVAAQLRTHWTQIELGVTPGTQAPELCQTNLRTLEFGPTDSFELPRAMHAMPHDTESRPGWVRLQRKGTGALLGSGQPVVQTPSTIEIEIPHGTMGELGGPTRSSVELRLARPVSLAVPFTGVVELELDGGEAHRLDGGAHGIIHAHLVEPATVRFRSIDNNSDDGAVFCQRLTNVEGLSIAQVQPQLVRSALLGGHVVVNDWKKVALSEGDWIRFGTIQGEVTLFVKDDHLLVRLSGLVERLETGQAPDRLRERRPTRLESWSHHPTAAALLTALLSALSTAYAVIRWLREEFRHDATS